MHLVQDTICDVQDLLGSYNMSVRAISFDVRRAGGVPEKPGGRFQLYLGTGGPGHLDPAANDGLSEGSQGITENPAWCGPLFELFDAILEDDEAVLLAVCHTFGVMCRWAGVAQPRLRHADKGGKSTGVLENMLTSQAQKHPWFSRFSAHLPDGSRLRIMDNRLFDLIPDKPLPSHLIPIGYETLGVGGPKGEAITMIEWARDKEGVMPRVFGVNHHPEIVDRERQLLILERKRERGEVTPTWYEERLDLLTRTYPLENSDQRLALTSDYTLVAPLRFHLIREIRRRAQSMGHSLPFHEDQYLQQPR